MVSLGMWLQTGDVSADYIKYLTIFVGILAVALLIQAVGLVLVGMRALNMVKDFKASFDEAKVKVLPLMSNVYDITVTTHEILTDVAPKIKVISENVVETSHTVRQTVDKLDVTLRQTADKAVVTFEDANLRTQRQIARVDSMVASTLSATAELGATINHGIRVPARKMAELMTQSKHMLDMLLVRAKAFGAGVNAMVRDKPAAKNDHIDW